jgi:hypothetical protein
MIEYPISPSDRRNRFKLPRRPSTSSQWSQKYLLRGQDRGSIRLPHSAQKFA